MLNLGTDVTNALAGNEIWPVRLVSIQIGDTTYRISDHYRNIAIGTDTYLPNGNLLSIDNIKNAVEFDNGSIEVSLSVIDGSFRSAILDANSIGGVVTIYRGLINATTGNVISTPFRIYEGIIYSVSINEEAPDDLSEVVQAVTFTAVAEVRSTTYRLSETPGRLTNNASQRAVDSTDRSMEYVAGLNGVNVRFGGTD